MYAPFRLVIRASSPSLRIATLSSCHVPSPSWHDWLAPGFLPFKSSVGIIGGWCSNRAGNGLGSMVGFRYGVHSKEAFPQPHSPEPFVPLFSILGMKAWCCLFYLYKHTYIHTYIQIYVLFSAFTCCRGSCVGLPCHPLPT